MFSFRILYELFQKYVTITVFSASLLYSITNVNHDRHFLVRKKLSVRVRGTEFDG